MVEKHTDCRSERHVTLTPSSHTRARTHTRLGISGYSAAHCRVPSCYTASPSRTGRRTHTEKSRGRLKNNMYMFTKGEITVNPHNAVTGRHQASGLTGRFPLSSFCGGTSFCFLETEFKRVFSCVNCADLPSGPCLARLLQNSPRPLRNLLTPLCSVSGSSSRYCSTLCSNRPVEQI